MGRSIEAMVEEQVRRYRAKQAALARARVPDAPAPPVVVVSREFGAGGGRIGASVAETLGFELWDRALVQAIAERSGASEALVETLDEHARTALEDLIAHSLMGKEATEHDYLLHLHRVLHTVTSHGGAVIVGRGAQFVVDPARSLRVRVIAPFEERVAAYAEREGIELEEARRRVRERDADRATFIKRYFRADPAAPRHYDLVIHRAGFSEAQVAEVVVAAFRARFGAI